VAFSAHFAKGNASAKSSIDRVSGSGVFARDPDTILTFTQHEENDAFSVEATLRNFRPVDPFVVRWQYPLFRRDDALDPDKLKQPGKPRAHSPRDLLLAVIGRTADNPVTISAWAGMLGIPRRTLADYMPELRRSGLIATLGEGTKARQFITQKGVELCS